MTGFARRQTSAASCFLPAPDHARKYTSAKWTPQNIIHSTGTPVYVETLSKEFKICNVEMIQKRTHSAAKLGLGHNGPGRG
jgi:hypothetical protein